MCVFSRPVQHVSQTHIFARRLSPGRQLLAYAMQYGAVDEVAMILPLPVPAACDEDAVRFLDLSAHPSFFDDLDRCFDRLVVYSGHTRSSASLLRVHEVGAFEASFVPTVADFARLDPRFRLVDDVMAALPGGDENGFAVVQLRAVAAVARIHPIALDFPTRYPGHLFYPTLHVHDDTVPERADFAHVLYAQHGDMGPFGSWQPWPGGCGPAPSLRWERTRHVSPGAASARDLIASGQILFRTRIKGTRPNVDLWLDLE